MKEVVIPTKQENFINIVEIDEDFMGVIIAYKNEKPVGFYKHDYVYEYPWFLSNKVNDDNRYINNTEGYSFYEAVMNGIKNKVFDKLKVIEFD